MAITDGFLAEFGVLLAKKEAAYGTDPTLALASNGIPVLRRPTITMGIQHAEVALDRAKGGLAPGPKIAESAQIEFEVPLYGIGEDTSVVQIARWVDALLRTCGSVDQSGGSPAGAQVTWSPQLWDSLAQTDTSGTVTNQVAGVTFGGYMGIKGRPDSGTSIYVEMNGVRPTQIVFNLPTRGLATLRYTGVGLLVEPSDATLSSGGTDLTAYDYESVADFMSANGLATKIGLISDGAPSQETDSDGTTITVEFGTELVAGDTRADGNSHAATGDIRVYADVRPIIVPQATFDWQSAQSDPLKYDSGALDLYNFTAGPIKSAGRSADTGYSFKWEIPEAQVSPFEYDRAGKRVRAGIRVVSRPSAEDVEHLILTIT